MGGRERPQQIITDPYSEYEPVYANCRNYKHPRTSQGGFSSVCNFRVRRCKKYRKNVARIRRAYVCYLMARVCSSICSSLVFTIFILHAMAPCFVLKPLTEQAVVLEDQREMAICGICSENYSAERKGYKCSARELLGACQYPTCLDRWMRLEDSVCRQCRRPAHPYFDRQLTDR